MANNGPGLIVYGSAFYELDPPYLCTYSEPHPPSKVDNAASQFSYTVPCDQETVCGSSSSTLLSYKIDEQSKFYVQNWIEQMNLTCTPRGYIGAIGSFSFAAAALACLFLPRISDKYGRLIVYRTTIFLTIPLFLIMNLTKSITGLYFVTFMLGIALLGRFTCAFVLLTECNLKR